MDTRNRRIGTSALGIRYRLTASVPDKTKPLITVGIACFDAADTIARAIRSAQEQDWPSLEILVVDDGSKDGSPKVVDRIARDDNRIRLVRHPGNLGSGQTRTTIVENATGEFLVFSDDDDVSDPKRVERQFERILSYERETGVQLVACYTGRVTVQPDGSRSNVSCIGHRPNIPHGRLVLDYLLLHEIAPGYSYGEMGSWHAHGPALDLQGGRPFRRRVPALPR